MQSKRIFFAALISSFLLACTLVATGSAQAQGSVADAARKAQAEKKSSGKPVVVFTNDNLDAIRGSISIVGETPAAQAAQAATTPDKGKLPAADDKSKTPATAPAVVPSDDKKPPASGEVYWRKIFNDARKKVADDTHELDILQREYNLKQQQYYSDPNTAMREQFSRQDLTDTKTKIDDKTAAVAQDKQAISDLEDDMRKSGGEPGWATP